MKTLLIAIVLGSVLGLLSAVAMAEGEDPIRSGCAILVTDAGVASSSVDSDCKWQGGTVLSMQCDVAVYYTRNGTTPTSSSPKLAVGDPYRIRASGTDVQLQVLPVAGASATCNVYQDLTAR